MSWPKWILVGLAVGAFELDFGRVFQTIREVDLLEWF